MAKSLARCTVVILALTMCLLGRVRADDSDHRYKYGDSVPFYANIVGPYHNPSETYGYFDLPFCSPVHVKEKKKSLGMPVMTNQLKTRKRVGGKTYMEMYSGIPRTNHCLQLLLDVEPSYLHLFIFLLAMVGVFYPCNRGSLLTALVVIYALTSGIAGYTSTSFYCQLEGTKWVRNLLLTGCLFSGPLFFTFCFLDTVAIAYNATAALPFGTIVVLVLIWTLGSSPLLVLGGIAGRNSNNEFKAPCNTTKCPREIPPVSWYKKTLPQMALAGILPFGAIYIELYYMFASVWGFRIYNNYGILFIVFTILVLVTAFVTVALTYFQLAAEDHQWWWRSFLCSGSTGVFIYIFCFSYYFKHSNMSGFMQTSFFFGYMACICYGLFLMLGTVGFRASTFFVRHIYRSIKCE